MPGKTQLTTFSCAVQRLFRLVLGTQWVAPESWEVGAKRSTNGPLAISPTHHLASLTLSLGSIEPSLVLVPLDLVTYPTLDGW